MKSVARRVIDGAMLQLIKMWLEAPVEETDERGQKHRTTRKGRGPGHSTRGSDLPVVQQSLHASVRAGLEDAGAREASRGVRRQLRRRLRDLLSRHRRRGAGRDAGHDVEAEADGERDQDAGLPAAGRDVRLPGLHVRPLLLAADGAGLSGHRAVEEAVKRICEAISSETGRNRDPAGCRKPWWASSTGC